MDVAHTVAIVGSAVAEGLSSVMTKALAKLPSYDVLQTVVPTNDHTIIIPVNHGEKLENFNGLNFKKQQQNILFYLTILNFASFLTENAPKLYKGEGDVQAISTLDAWKQSNFLCRNYAMNDLADSLYNMYSTMKLLRNCGKQKYKIETKKFIVGKFLYYKLVDSKIVISQVQELCDFT